MGMSLAASIEDSCCTVEKVLCFLGILWSSAAFVLANFTKSEHLGPPRLNSIIENKIFRTT